MSAAREAKPSEGPPRARRDAQARRARPRARWEARHVVQRFGSPSQGGRPKGPSPRDDREADTRNSGSSYRCKEAEV